MVSGAMLAVGAASASEAEVDFSMRAQVRYTSKRRRRMPRRRIEGWSTVSDFLVDHRVWFQAYVESVIFSTQSIVEQMSVDLRLKLECVSVMKPACHCTCGLIKTKSMNSTTKSCSTYLSAKRLHRGHWVNRTPLPRDRSSALLYDV